jgi:hypothetical protein
MVAASRGIMATKRRFGIGDEVNVKGIVRLIDVAGPGKITIELLADRNCRRPMPSFDARGPSAKCRRTITGGSLVVQGL